MDRFIVEAVVLGGLADHLELLVQLPNVESRFVFGLRFQNGFVDEIAVLTNQNIRKIFVLQIVQTRPPVKNYFVS